MKHLLRSSLILLAALPALAQPTVTSVVVSAIGHSSARVQATSSLSVSGNDERVRWGVTTAYEGSSDGGLLAQGMQQCDHDAVHCPGVYQIYATLSGLSGNTLYHVQMQASADGGATWGSSSDQTFTTLPNPALDPAMPTPPETFNTAYPDTSAYDTTTYTPSTVHNCSDLQAALTHAVNNRGAGWVISLAPGLFDSTSAVCAKPPVDPSAMAFGSANVDTTGNTITVTGTVTANEPFRFGTDVLSGSSLPGVGVSQFITGPFLYGTVYYAINPVPSGGNTTFQVSYTSGGSAVAMSNGGTGTSYVVPIPAPGGPEIIIRTSTPDAQFCPVGVRCLGATWSAKMAKLEVVGGQWEGGVTQFGPLVFESYVGAHDIRLMGLEITQTDVSSLANTSSDPKPTYSLVDSEYQVASTRIFFDRTYVHGLPAPNRMFRTVADFDGKYMAFINSDLEADYYRPWLGVGMTGPGGFAQTISGSTVSTLDSVAKVGPVMGAAQTCTGSGISATFTSGTATGQAVLYFANSPTCEPHYVIPTGETATCTGTGSDGVNVRACAVTTAASPTWVADTNGSQFGGCVPLAIIALTSGVPTSTALFGPSASAWWTEGSNAVIAGGGPGPWQVYNNYINSPGLSWHWDDGLSGIGTPKGYVVQRNAFTLSAKYHTGAAGSDNFDYEQRNSMEWKNGSQCLIDGNTFSNFFAGVTSLGSALTFTPRGLATITDCEISNNTNSNGNYFLSAIGGFATGGQVAPNPLRRFWIHNNVNDRPDSWHQYSPVNRFNATGPYAFYLGLAMEDVIVEHNFSFNPSGPDPAAIHMLGQPIEGMVTRNNFFFCSNDNNAYCLNSEGLTGNTPNCNGLIAKGYTDPCFVKGVGTPSWLTGGNVLVPYYATTNPPSGVMPASTTVTDWGGSGFSAPTTQTGMMSGSNGGINFIRGDTTLAARVANVGITNPAAGNFGLIYNSPYKSGAHTSTDGTDGGVDWNKLRTAQGQVGPPSVLGITTTSATITWWAYDGSFACWVDYATAPNDPSTQTGGGRAHASTGNSQSVTLSVTTHTPYNYRVLCPVQQPTGSFQTR